MLCTPQKSVTLVPAPTTPIPPQSGSTLRQLTVTRGLCGPSLTDVFHHHPPRCVHNMRHSMHPRVPGTLSSSSICQLPDSPSASLITPLQSFIHSTNLSRLHSRLQPQCYMLGMQSCPTHACPATAPKLAESRNVTKEMFTTWHDGCVPQGMLMF